MVLSRLPPMVAIRQRQAVSAARATVAVAVVTDAAMAVVVDATVIVRDTQAEQEMIAAAVAIVAVGAVPCRVPIFLLSAIC
jgi:hypothetical protein